MAQKSVVITGASRGIGRSIALNYARRGYQVAISCRKSRAELDKTAAQIRELGAECLACQKDMGNFKEAEDFIGQAAERFGAPDILINNAGISYLGLLQEMSCEEWELVLRTNLTSAFHCCKLIIPHMLRKHKGHIVNISSVWGGAGASMEVAYSASKGGMNAFTKALAKELAPSGIQVNAIACGIIDTDMNKFLSETERNHLLNEIPAGRMGTPEEVAELTMHITESPAYLTGQIISMDGGWI